MMIDVEQAVRRYGKTTAVDGITFTVARGEMVGFLGPNGAGKTTTMRMLAGFLPASSGRLRVAGYDVAEDSLEVRRRIGYLPESCPLYPEMRVDEYLSFRARLKGVRGRRVTARRDEVKTLCGLEAVGRQVIGALSKGFRQRVGLADALVHEPELLILDEPTIGLDPNQIRQVRELIRQLAERHTILLSTHILPEVEMACRRVLIIHRGRLVASDSPENLRRRFQGGARVTAELRAGEAATLETALRALPGVAGVTLETAADGWRRATLDAAPGADPRVEIFELAARHGWPLRELQWAPGGSLEDIFVSLTSREDAT